MLNGQTYTATNDATMNAAMQVGFNALAPAAAQQVAATGHNGGPRMEKLDLFNPSVLEGVMRLCGILAESTIVPKDFQGNPGNILIAIQWGRELGLEPLQAMQSIAVINGRPAIWGDAMLALVRGSGLMESIREETIDDPDDGRIAICTIKRRGETAVQRTFSMEQAKRAGLAGKPGPWQQYPDRMLQLRARGFGLRDVFPDVLRGVWIAEEARDTPVEPRDITPEEDPPPARKNRATSAAKAVSEKLAIEKAPAADAAPTLKSVLDAIYGASDEAELNAACAGASKLEDEHKKKAREAYSARLHELREAATAEPERAATDNGAAWQDLLDRIAGDLLDGANPADLLRNFAPQIAQMRAEAPGIHKALCTEISGYAPDLAGTF